MNLADVAKLVEAGGVLTLAVLVWLEMREQRKLWREIRTAMARMEGRDEKRRRRTPPHGTLRD